VLEPRIAILLAAFNGIEFIEQQLQSIEQQKNVDVSIFISVDLSTDNTYKWCVNYAKQHSEIKVLSYGEKFGGAAPNFFRLIKDVDFSDFDYIALADQDDIWLVDKLISACKQIKEKKVNAYSSNVLAFWDDGREILINKAQPQRKYDYLFEAAGPGCTYVLEVKPMLAFKKMIIERWAEVNNVDLHDWLIYAFFRGRDYQWLIDPIPKMRYRQHEDNQVGINKGWKATFRRLSLLRSGWYKEQVLLIAQLVNTDNSLFTSRWHLLKKITQLRRDWKDRLVLCACVLMGLFK
jgi:rhamnosyltransferase